MFIYKVLEEYIGYFHQPYHYPTINELNKFLGNKNRGAFKILSQAYYVKAWRMLPKDIKKSIEYYDHGGSPCYDNVKKNG